MEHLVRLSSIDELWSDYLAAAELRAGKFEGIKEYRGAPLTKTVHDMTIDPTDDPVLAEMWRFVRGDADVAEFERWAYARSDDLASRLADKAHLELVSAD